MYINILVSTHLLTYRNIVRLGNETKLEASCMAYLITSYQISCLIRKCLKYRAVRRHSSIYDLVVAQTGQLEFGSPRSFVLQILYMCNRWLIQSSWFQFVTKTISPGLWRHIYTLDVAGRRQFFFPKMFLRQDSFSSSTHLQTSLDE